jgi:hypothetical protein
LSGGKLKLADTTLKLALSRWYLQESEEDFPLVTELSFDYDLPEEKQSKDELEQFASRRPGRPHGSRGARPEACTLKPGP